MNWQYKKANILHFFLHFFSSNRKIVFPNVFNVILLALALSLVRCKRSRLTVYSMAVSSFLSGRKINDTAIYAFRGWNSYSPNDEGIRTVIVTAPS